MSEPREIKIDLTDNYRLVYDFCGNKFLQKKAVSKKRKLAREAGRKLDEKGKRKE